MNKLAIIIPTFNRSNTLKKLLGSLKDQTVSDFTTIAVVDGSTDDTLMMLEQHFPETKIVNGTGNWWWTKSVNEGLKYAKSIGMNTFLLMNDDTYVSPNFLKTLISSYHKSNNGVIGAISVNQADHKIFDAGIYKNNWITAKLYPYYKRGSCYDQEKLQGVRPAIFLAGRGMLFNDQVIETIDYFDEKEFPQYMADYDFSHKAYLAHIPVNICWDTPVFSYIDMTSEGNVDETSFLRLIASFFNDKTKQSLTKNIAYYKRFAGYRHPLSLCFHYARVVASFTLNKLKRI